MWGRLGTLIVKELALSFRDPQSRRLLILPVILQIALFPFAATLEVKNATLAVLNRDGGQNSIELIQRLSRTAAFTRLRLIHSDAELERVVDEQQALLVLVFPQDFSRSIAAGRRATIQAVVDGRRSNAAQIAFSYAGSVVQDYATERAAAAGIATESRIDLRNWYNPNLEYRWHILPNLVAIITTIGALVVTALTVAREREQGTFEQLLVSPLTPGLIMVGKTVPAIVVAVMQATIIVLAAIFVYGVPFHGSVLLLYLSMVCYGLSLAGFGLFISSVARTQQQAFLGVFSFMVPAILLSGFIAPVENMPLVFRWISWFDPLRHFIVIVEGLFLKGFGAGLVWSELWPLLLIAGSGFLAGDWMFRRRVA